MISCDNFASETKILMPDGKVSAQNHPSPNIGGSNMVDSLIEHFND
jgi:hypothetical protein